MRARVPDVTGDDESGWAMPCAPFGGAKTGFFAVPRSAPACGSSSSTATPTTRSGPAAGGAAATEIPPPLLIAAAVQEGDGAHRGRPLDLLDDTPGIGGITLETAQGAKIAVTATGIEIANGMGAAIKLTGPQVSVNNGALEVI